MTERNDGCDMALETEAKNSSSTTATTAATATKAKENNNTVGGKKNLNSNQQAQNLVNGNGTAADGPAAKKKGAFNSPVTPPTPSRGAPQPSPY